MAQLQGAPSDIYSGKPRLEIGEIKPLEMTPWDVAQGLVWGIDATIWQGGQSPVAPGVKRAEYVINSGDAHVFYRRGARWITAKKTGWPAMRRIDKDAQQFGDFALRRHIQIKVNLDEVPRDAEEVRLRGFFEQMNTYVDAGCRGISGGAGWSFHGRGCRFTMQSKPFDIPIVNTKGAWPAPKVSRQSTLKLVDAKWIDDPYSSFFVLQVRHKDGSEWKNRYLAVHDAKVLDAKQQPLELLTGRIKWKQQIYNFSGLDSTRFSPQIPKSDHVFQVLDLESTAPRQGWENVKFPLTLRAQVSDGTCWPLKIDTKVERVQMRTEDFGAAK
ncbi:MAG TPA: hypothetical protein VF627_10945 [Abditibacterium sp.]